MRPRFAGPPAAIVLAIAAAAIAGCGSNSSSTGSSTTSASHGSAPPSGKPFVLGMAIAQTGFASAYDGPAAKFAQYKVDELNKQGGLLGHPIKVIKGDTKSDIQQGAVVGQELLQKGADDLAVTCDYDYGGAAARVANAAHRLALSVCAGSPKFGVQGIGPYAFTFGDGTPGVGAGMAEFAHEQGYDNAYVLKDTTIEYSNTVCAAFEKRWAQLGGTVSGQDSFKNSDPTIASQITRLKGSSTKPGFIAFCSYLPGGASAIKQLRDSGVDVPIVTGDSMDGNGWLKAVPNLNDVFVLTHASLYGDDPSAKVNQLIARYTKETGELPSTSHGVLGYVLVEALAEAARRAKSLDPTALKNALETFDKVPFLTGPTTFTKTSHITNTRPLRIISIENGTPHFLKTHAAEQVPSVN